MNSAVGELTKSIGNSSWILEWKKLEEAARRNRGENLMIYNVSVDSPGVLYLPSNFTHQQRKEYGLQELGTMEYELRVRQIIHLERLRECLAEKSLRFRTKVKPAKSQKKMVRTWESIH